MLLFYGQGLTHREVAAELNISVGAVKARLHQARAALERTLPMCTTPEEVPAMPQHDHSPVWREAFISEVRRREGADPTRQPHVALLQERAGDRTLPIWIGPAEATALALSIETVEMPRPMTYQLASSAARGMTADSGSNARPPGLGL